MYDDCSNNTDQRSILFGAVFHKCNIKTIQILCNGNQLLLNDVTCQKVLHNLNSRSEVLFFQVLLNKEAKVEVFKLHKKICQEFVISLFPFQRENEEYI